MATARKTNRRSNSRFLAAVEPFPQLGGALPYEFTEFESADLMQWLDAARLPPAIEPLNPAYVSRFNAAATMFLVRRQLSEKEGYRAFEEWARQIEKYAESLLYALGVDPAEAPFIKRVPQHAKDLFYKPPLSAEIREQAFRAMPFNFNDEAAYHDCPMTGPGFSPRPILERSPASIAAVMLVARDYANVFASQVSSGRPEEPGRADFFAETVSDYERLTGQKAGISKSAARAEPSGPCVRFHEALLISFRAKLPKEVIELDPGSVAALKLNASQIADAIKKAVAGIQEISRNE
jgi:hypothetical protein